MNLFGDPYRNGVKEIGIYAKGMALPQYCPDFLNHLILLILGRWLLSLLLLFASFPLRCRRGS